MRYLSLICLGVVVWVVASGVHHGAAALGVPLDLSANRGPGQIALYVTAILVFLAFTKWVWRVEFLPPIALYWRHRGRAVRGFFSVAIVVATIGFLGYYLLWQIGAAHWSDNRWERLGTERMLKTLLAFAVGIALAVTEEGMFRGLIFNYLRAGRRGWALAGAVFGSALIFALVHGFRDPLAWLTAEKLPLLTGLTLLGVLLAVTYMVSGSIACAAGVHAGLVWVKVFFRRTKILELDQTEWWMGTDKDLRTAPVVWALFAALALAVWCSRHHLRRRFAVPPDGDTSRVAEARERAERVVDGVSA